MATERDPTFHKFTAKQGKAYAAARGISYPSRVFEDILAFHNGPTDLAIDLGCGPGNVTRDLCRYFSKVVGIDNSAGMVEAAESFLDDETKGKVSYKMGPAEEIDQIEGLMGKVDLITAAIAVSCLFCCAQLFWQP